MNYFPNLSHPNLEQEMKMQCTFPDWLLTSCKVRRFYYKTSPTNPTPCKGYRITHESHLHSMAMLATMTNKTSESNKQTPFPLNRLLCTILSIITKIRTIASTPRSSLTMNNGEERNPHQLRLKNKVQFTPHNEPHAIL